MGKRLYVGNLPYDADEASLREVFSQDGRIVERVHIVLDRETQRPRGFAFVEFSTDDQAKQAMAALDGTMFGMRQLRVTEAEERRPAGAGGGPPRGPGGGAPRYDRGPAPGGGARPGGGYAGSAGGGGTSRPLTEEEARANRFGPDARPKHERGPDRKPPPKRRGEGESNDAYGGRRGSRRFDDDEE